MGSWIPFTPKKPVQGRSSSLIVDESVMHQELNGFPGGGYEERRFCNNGVVQDLNYTVQGMDQNGVYDHGPHQGGTNKNMMINGLAGSYAQARSNSERNFWGRSDSGALLAPVNGNHTSNVGRVNGSFNQSGSSQAGHTDFELDDLMNPNLMPISFTSLLSGGDHLFKVPQYGTPSCSRPLYNLNSPTRREESWSVCESPFQPLPSTPSLCRTGQDNRFLEKIVTTTGHGITEPKSDKSMQSIVDSSVVNSTVVTEKTDGSRQDVLEFDLNKTPQQKPSKRKKFMPKVVVEGKPKRKPRKPATQENVKSKETGSGKRKKGPKTNLKESATKKSANVDMSNTSPEVTLKSCRKALNFNLEKTGDARQGDTESEIVQNNGNLNSFSETRDATGGTSGSFLDSVTQIDQINGLVSTNQPRQASIRNQPDYLSTGAKLPRVSQESHTHILARDQQCQFPVATQNTQFPMGNQQAWLQMKNQLNGFPFGNQQPRMTTNQQPFLAMGNQQPMYLMGTSRPALVSGNQQLGGLQGNKRPMFLNHQTFVPAGNRQYGSPTGMHQLVMSTGGQQHGLLMKNQQPGFLLRNQQSEYLMRGHQPCVPLMNQELGTPEGFTHLNQMVAACMPSPELQPHSPSRIPATNQNLEYVSRSLNGTAGTCQRSSIPEYSALQPAIHQENEYSPSHDARGSKRQYHRAMGQTQNHYLHLAGHQDLLQQIPQSQDLERQNSRTCEEYLYAAKKNKIQKVVQENSHGMPPEVIEVEDDPTGGARKDKDTACIVETSSKGNPCLDNEKCVVPKTPAKKGRPGRKKSEPCIVETASKGNPCLDNEKCIIPKTPARKGRPGRKKSEPTLPKTPSSTSKAKKKERNSIQDSGKAKGTSGELICQDYIAEIIYMMQNLNLGDGSREEEQNALVLYRGDGAVVPYESTKKKPRPKVDLDDETSRIWNLLMGKAEKEEGEDMDKKKEKWWEEERRVFKGRADSFIARMHLVQGDRRFSPWKGSVVDSVIGVFLTQNVTDHLSSSAFMSLAARFPPPQSSRNSVVVEDPEGCVLNLNEFPSWQEKVQNPSDTQVSGVDNGSKDQQRGCSNSGIERFDFLENSSQNLEEEVLSSQDSFDPAVFQSCGRVGSCSGSKSDTEFSSTRCETKTVSGSAQSVQIGSPNLSDEICLQGNERPPLYEGSGDAQIQETIHLVRNPSSSYEQSTIREPQVVDIEDFGMQGESLGYSWLSISPRVDGEKNKNIPRRFFRKGGNDPRELTDQIIPTTPHDILVESNSSNKEQTAVEYKETNATIVREMKGTLADGKKPTSQWDSLRKDVEGNEGKKERSKNSMDSIDYEAIRRASISDISEAIKERGMNNMLAVRIKDFLERIVKDHGGIDLEWLRSVPPDKAKDYLLSIRGLGLKSVECVRLLTLHNLAFPVDTNVGRIAVRLGWVPLQTLPESLQIHLLELYPVLESIQKYLWPRLCKLDQPTLYQLHYQLITFGKVFCTKSRPNCNACPMRGECRHFASAYASARLALPAPEDMSLTSAMVPVPPQSFPPVAIPRIELPSSLERPLIRGALSNGGNCEPIIEEPASPEQEECTEITESDIEDAYYNEDPDEIPTIKLNIEQFGMTLREHMERNMELQEGDISQALVALNPTTTSIPTPKLKNISRLRTEHQVYVLPDSHPLLDGMDKREPDDPSPYLLAIWTPGETANSAQPPQHKCGGKASGKMCFDETCSECNSARESNSQTVRGTLLIPCRTAMRGSFPLNGTYFQVNELFADHNSSLKPIDVPRDWLWKLRRRTVYFGTSVTSIFKGLSTEQIQDCFWRGYVCVRGFEQKTRAPRPLMARLHFTASKLKTKKI